MIWEDVVIIEIYFIIVTCIVTTKCKSTSSFISVGFKFKSTVSYE